MSEALKVTPDQAADVFLSLACGCFQALREMEPAQHTRRARELARMEAESFKLLSDGYKSQLASRECTEVAARVIRAAEAALWAEMGCGGNSANEGRDM